MTDNEKNVKAIAEAGEIEKYSKEWFQMKGSLGGKKRWEGTTEEERKEHGKKLTESRQKFSTGE